MSRTRASRRTAGMRRSRKEIVFFGLGSKPVGQNKDEKHNQNDTDETNAVMAVPVSVAAESTTETAKQENNENDDE